MDELLGLSAPDTLSVVQVLLSLLIAAALSGLVSWHFMRFGSTFSNRAKFARVLPAIALTTVLVISIVKASLALSLGLVGALSIVRFRTPVKEPEELAYLFLAIAIGLALGADQWLVGVSAVVLILLLLTARSLFRPGARYPNLFMNVELGEVADAGKTVQELLAVLTEHTTAVDLRRYDAHDGRLQGTFYLDVADVDQLVGSQQALQARFPGASVTVVEQSTQPGA
jgi:ABC-type multidrug transport system fused ATPase/permease subunit